MFVDRMGRQQAKGKQEARDRSKAVCGARHTCIVHYVVYALLFCVCEHGYQPLESPGATPRSLLLSFPLGATYSCICFTVDCIRE